MRDDLLYLVHILECIERIERKRDRGIVGNLYKSRITNVLPGMQASFVDIAHERAGFLHFSEQQALLPPSTKKANKLWN